MKRFLMACLGMVLLGAAGLILLHHLVESPPAALAQPGPAAGGGGAPVGPGPAQPGEAVPAAEPGQYKEIVPPLLEALADADGTVRELAAATLVKIGPDAVPPLTEALKAKDRETRANAAYVLGHLGQAARDALPALAKALKDDDKEVRRRVAYAMHSIVSGSTTMVGFAAAPPDEPGAGGKPGPGMVLRAPPGGPGGGMPVSGALSAPVDPGLLVPAPEKKKQ
jgi:hypothetical protein